MHTFIALVIGLVAGFAGGWAFFKHRAEVKKAVIEEVWLKG